METLNSLLSNDIGYLNALRHAPAVPPPAPAAITPPEIILPGKKFKFPTWGWIIAGLGLSALAVYKWRQNQEKNKSKNI